MKRAPGGDRMGDGDSELRYKISLKYNEHHLPAIERMILPWSSGVTQHDHISNESSRG